jgi:hypothetical protein
MKKTILFLVMALALTTSTLFAQVPSYVPTNGLVGYWPFNGNANDISGNGNNGTNNGATLTTDRNGNINSAYSFDGQNDYISCSPLIGIQEVTISVWLKKSGLGGHLVSQNDWTTAQNVSFGSAYEKSSNNFSVGVNSGNCNFQGSQSSTSIFYNLDSNWHHRVVTINNLGLIRDYLDGQLINSSTISNFQWCNSTSAILKFGAWWNSDIQSWEGKIDDIGIWNRVLTQQEITNLYNSSLPQTACLPANVPTTGLVGYWPFCGNANDESGNANNGTVNGAALTTDRFGNDNSAYSFDGVNDYIVVNNNSSLCPSVYSISAWVKPVGYYLNGQDDANYILGKGTDFNQGHYSLHYKSISRKSRASIGIGSSGLYVDSNSNVNQNNWIHLLSTWDGNTLKIYVNGILENSIVSNGITQGVNSEDLFFGTMANNSTWPYRLNGIIDDIGIWNRALTQEEITNLYNANQCFTNITVTDTLIINVGQLSFNDPVTWANNITIAPNPASTQININFNNITNLNGGTLKIINSLGQEVATTPITTSGTNSTMQLATWGGTGMYFVQIINPQGQIVDIKKIILQ